MSIRLLGIRVLTICGIFCGASSLRAAEPSYLSAGELTSSTREVNYAQRLEALEAELASLRSASATSSYEHSGSCSHDRCDCNYGGWIVGAELALLVPHNGALTSLSGTPVVLTPDYDLTASPRFWLGYRNEEGLGIRTRYWTLDANTDSVPPLGLSQSLHMETLDFEVTQLEQLSNWLLDLSAGLRWAQNRNEILGDGFVAALQDFQGGGLTVGLSAWRPLANRNLALFGNARASLLYGDNNYLLNVNPINNIGFVNGWLQARDEVVGIGELQLGVEWSSTLATGNRWYLRSAVEAQAWNMPSALAGLFDDTTGLVGFTFAAGINY